METQKLGSIGALAVFLFYLVIALEVIVMITPFTVYFYSIYAPVLNRLEANPATSWLTAFFLPHISYSSDLLLTGMAYLGPVLLGLGLAIFFICAFQVYSAKLLKRGVVSRGLYAAVRHPQYLGLGIAGLGLLFYWPRFIILVFYLTMLFVYYLLARVEEGRMERKYGESYRKYEAQIAMFFLGEPGGKIFAWLTGGLKRKGWALAGLYFLILSVGIGAAFGLRSYAKARLSLVSENGILAVSLSPLEQGEIRRLLRASQEDPEVKRLMAKYRKNSGRTLVAYIVPQDYMMEHLIADLGEHEAHHGEGEQGGTLAVMKHLGEMYVLKPMRQLREGKESRNKRIIFTEARTADRKEVPIRRALDAGILRYPLFFADLKGVEVALTMEVPQRHSWGTIPVPAF